MNLAGRKNFSKTGRIEPRVRFRQVRFGDRPRPRQSTASFLTPVGWAVAVGSLALAGFLAWFFVFSTNFLVNAAEVTAPTSLSKEQMDSVFYDLQDQRILFWVPGNHIVFLSEKRLSKALNKNYPYIAGAENFKKDWPKKIAFAVKEISPVFVYTDPDGKRYLIDETGTVVGEPLGELSPNLVEISGVTETPVFGQKLTGAKFLALILEIQKKWSWADFRPGRFEIKNQIPEGEIELKTTENWYIKLSGADKPANFLKNLGLILENEIGEQRPGLSYIDLRLQNRAFFCLRGQACSRR